MTRVRILIRESDPATADLLEEGLSPEYDVTIVERVAEARDLLNAGRGDFLLLGIDHPDDEGWELLAQLREVGPPIVVVTALGRAEDRVRALTGGADDVVSIPFNLDELKARIAAVVRRTLAAARPGIDLRIDDVRKEVIVGARRVTLSPKEYELLRLLYSSPGRVFSSGEIRRRLWPRGHATVQDVQKYIYLLRRKLEENPKDPRLIVTVRGFGYRIAA